MRTQKNRQRVDGERSSRQRKKTAREATGGSGACPLRARVKGGFWELRSQED